MINAIIFDLSEVYLRGIIGSQKYLQETIGTQVADNDLFIPELNALFTGKITEEAYWKAVIEKHDWKISIDKLKVTIRKNFQEIRGTRKIIEDLKKKRKHQLVLFSNHATEWISFCEKMYQYQSLFDVIIYSFQEGYVKPHEKLLRILFQKIKKPPHKCLFIDDRIENLIVAKKYSSKTIQFTSPRALRKSLTEAGIL